MTQATALYELYRHLPKKERQAFKHLIENEDNIAPVVEQIREGIKEIKAIQNGKAKSIPARQFLEELKQELENG